MEENTQIGSGIVAQNTDFNVGNGLMDISNQGEKNLLKGGNLQRIDRNGHESGTKGSFLRKSTERCGTGKPMESNDRVLVHETPLSKPGKVAGTFDMRSSR